MTESLTCPECNTPGVEREDRDGHGYMLLVCPNDDCPRIVLRVLDPVGAGNTRLLHDIDRIYDVLP